MELVWFPLEGGGGSGGRESGQLCADTSAITERFDGPRYMHVGRLGVVPVANGPLFKFPVISSAPFPPTHPHKIYLYVVLLLPMNHAGISAPPHQPAPATRLRSSHRRRCFHGSHCCLLPRAAAAQSMSHPPQMQSATGSVSRTRVRPYFARRKTRTLMRPISTCRAALSASCCFPTTVSVPSSVTNWSPTMPSIIRCRVASSVSAQAWNHSLATSFP